MNKTNFQEKNGFDLEFLLGNKRVENPACRSADPVTGLRGNRCMAAGRWRLPCDESPFSVAFWSRERVSRSCWHSWRTGSRPDKSKQGISSLTLILFFLFVERGGGKLFMKSYSSLTKIQPLHFLIFGFFCFVGLLLVITALSKYRSLLACILSARFICPLACLLAFFAF